MAKLYREIALLVGAIYYRESRDMDENNTEWMEKHEDKIEKLCKEYLPRGSGFDAESRLDLDKSYGDRLVFRSYFHHMNSDGYYDGWSNLIITVRPSLSQGFTLTITGIMRKYKDCAEYFYETFYSALNAEIEKEN